VNAADNTDLRTLEAGVNAGSNTANAETPVNGRIDNGYIKSQHKSFSARVNKILRCAQDDRMTG
jgi:hypothetical protein